ncbi:MAG: Ku protein [Myxococcales bacterium]|nr:Ku protein [Myxococcales bacterium]
MPARAISSGTISFGLVAIPVKLYTSASSEQVRFNMLHEKCGSRLKQQYLCPVDNEVVDRESTVKGYEYSRGQYVRFSDEEIKALESERSASLEITEFVPLASVDFVQVEKSYYLGPDKGGDKPYQLLGECMRKKGVVAVGRWAARGKEQLVLIRPYAKDGLVLHQLYYQNEVRDFGEIDTGARFTFSEIEHELAEKLIEQLTSAGFAPEKYKDTYEDRVKAAVEKKVAGQEITVAPEAPRAQIIDLFEALKRSLAEAQERVANVDGADAPKPPVKARADEPAEKKVAARRTRAKK